MDHPGAFWEERLIRPVDVYPQFRAEGPWFLPREGAGAYRMTSVFVHVETDSGVTGTGGPITREQAHHVQTGSAPLLGGQYPPATGALRDVLDRPAVHGPKGLGME